ncbi:class I SAM-dependent methyltransferase (plasmid) [Streptomyces sp. BI20]|uniref:class I SAM-dependent methyltransferase n=1 Tax=Streptomyces sp. BI20 TaxID=3403460 RepID=UPI003C76C895
MSRPEHTHPTDPDAVGAAYDLFADAGATTVLGGNIHVGWWDPEHPEVPLPEATDRLTDLVADRLHTHPGRTLLDVGCGNGLPAVRIAETRGAHVTGITVGHDQLERAGHEAAGSPARDRLEFRHADAMRLPFADASFDDALAIESLLHMPDQRLALTELARVVRPAGRLVIADLCLLRPFRGPDEALLDGLLEVYEIARVNTLAEHRRHLTETGWEIEELSEVGDRIRPSFGHAAEAFRGLAGALPAPAAARITAAADLMARFGRHPDAGYVLVTARRP